MHQGLSRGMQIAYGLRTNLTVTVSPDDNVEIYKMAIENTAGVSRKLDIFFFLEWAFRVARMNSVEAEPLSGWATQLPCSRSGVASAIPILPDRFYGSLGADTQLRYQPA